MPSKAMRGATLSPAMNNDLYTSSPYHKIRIPWSTICYATNQGLSQYTQKKMSIAVLSSTPLIITSISSS